MLMTAQETYYGTNGRYAADVEALRPGFSLPTGLTVRFVAAEPNSYGVSATSAALGKGSCVVFVGRVPIAQRPRTAVEGKSFPEGWPACDGDHQSEAAIWNRHAERSLRTSMLRIARAQERWFGAKGSYTANLADLPATGIALDEIIRIRLTGQGPGAGFILAGTHERYQTHGCVLVVGASTRGVETPLDKRTPSAPFEVACDDFGK